MNKKVSPLRKFLTLESSSGILLLSAALLGLIAANTPVRHSYNSVLAHGFEIGGGIFYLKLTVLKVINYVLMTLFFFVIGLEVKRELVQGHLSTRRKAIMPFLAAIGGMALPAIIYLLIAGDKYSHGWGVPVATDIALAVGVLAIVGKRASESLRSFLLGLAVIDDIGAILIIAFVYSSGVDFRWIASSILALCAIVFFRKIGLTQILIYVALGSVLWYSLYRSDVHPTLAGVILGLLTPISLVPSRKSKFATDEGFLERMENALHPWTSYLVIPIFAFANAGVSITSESIRDAISSPIAWGIFFGLVVGKPLGIFATVFIATRTNIGEKPEGSTSKSTIATGSAAGIGFTVAIFIAHLAFSVKREQDIAIMAIILASLVSGILSISLFRFSQSQINPE
jgi:NhaA family Na+:H+ antiporter